MKAKQLIQLIEQSNQEINIRSYSGRGMYGDYCLGVTCDNEIKLVVEVLQLASQEDYYNREVEGAEMIFDDVASIMSTSKTDSIGWKTIIYWPSVKFSQKEEVEYENGEEVEDNE